MRALTKAETGVRYTCDQWEIIHGIYGYLESTPASYDTDTDLDNPDHRLTSAVMRLCMLVVIQDTSHVLLYDSPMMHYLAVHGIDEKSGTLRAPFFYTGILAGALWINRLLMLEVAIPLEAWPSLELQSKAQVESVHQRIHELHKEHLCEGSFSPTASILSQLAKGKAFNKLHFS